MLKNKKILIAGAGGLLGQSLVEDILQHGGEVIGFDLEIEKLQMAMNSKTNLDCSRLKLYQLDITNEQAVSALFAEQSGLTGAVNASYPRNKSYGADFIDVSLESFNDNVGLHLGSAFLFTRECTQYFLKHREPLSLVNIASIYGVIAPRFDLYKDTTMTMPIEYAAIKSAVIHISKYATSYVRDSNFRINTISPGGIMDAQPNVFVEKYRQQTHGKGMLDVNDVNGSIRFLLSDHSRFVNGQNLVVDDGFIL